MQSEIGHHTLTVARALQRLADVTLWTERSEAEPLDTGIPTVRFDPAAIDWPALNLADANIYNLGNNADFHRGIFGVARQCPGIVVLHDTRLQHFFARYAETPGEDRSFYLDCMARSHGEAGVHVAQRWLDGEEPIDTLVARYPLTASALEPAIAAIVHNPAELQILADQTRTPVFHVPLAYAAGPPPERGLAGGTLRIVIFGYLGPNRCLAEVLDALAALPDLDVMLDIYGLVAEQSALDAKIAALELGGRVRQHGFVPDSALRAALARADLAINLRFPSMGEASASQLRIWDAGLPSIVTRTGWYATLPDDAVFFADPGREVEMLCAHLTALRDTPALFRQAGLRGRALLEQRHHPDLYATQLVAIARQAPALHARYQALALARRAASALLDLGSSGRAAQCVDLVGLAIADVLARDVH